MWPNVSNRALCGAGMMLLLATSAPSASAQLPTKPRNLQVLPKDLSTDSVFTLMLGVADALGVTCGYCHPGGDNSDWKTTNFTGDVKPMKATARQMFRLVDRLNTELLPPIVNRGRFAVPVTCVTCHRGAPRPVTLEDTIMVLLDRGGADSAVAGYERLRARSAGRMTWDLTEFPLARVSARLVESNRAADAVKLLELDARLFPGSANVAYQLGTVYEKTGAPQLAIAQYHKVLSIEPGDCFLLCSDGLSNLVDGQEMAQLLTAHFYKKVPPLLVELANDRGGDDNVTVVLLHAANDAKRG